MLPTTGQSRELGHAGLINIERLASYPLLLLDGYSIRRLFDAACRLANVEPKILLESRAPHTLLALAEAGQGVAIIPSLQRTDRYKVRIVRVTHGRKPIRERVAIQWDRRLSTSSLRRHVLRKPSPVHAYGLSHYTNYKSQSFRGGAEALTDCRGPTLGILPPLVLTSR